MIRIVFSIALALLIGAGKLCAQAKQIGSKHKPALIWATEWSADGKFIAVGGDDSLVWLFSGLDYRLLHKAKLPWEVKNFQWHPHRNILAIAGSRGVHFYHAGESSLKQLEQLPTGGRAIAWNHDGSLLALADGIGVVRLMDSSGKLIRSIAKHNNHSYVTLGWHPHKNIFVTGSDELIVFDTSGSQLAMFRHRPENTLMLTARFHPSGEFITTGDYGHENEGLPTLLQFWQADGTNIKTIRGLHHHEIRNLQWNADGSLLATGSDGLRIFNTAGELIGQYPSTETIWGLSWHGDKLAAGTYSGWLSVYNSRAGLVKRLF